MLADVFPRHLWSWIATPMRRNPTADRPLPDTAERPRFGHPPLQPVSEVELHLHLRHLGWFS